MKVGMTVTSAAIAEQVSITTKGWRRSVKDVPRQHGKDVMRLNS